MKVDSGLSSDVLCNQTRNWLRSRVMARRCRFRCRQPDHVAATGPKRHQDLSLSTQPINLEKDLIPREIGETVRQGIEIAAVHPFHFPKNAMGDG